MRNLLVLIVIQSILFGNIKAQDLNHFFANTNDLELVDSNVLYFNFRSSNFLWNNEFFNDIVEGYTLIGYHVTPTLQYHFNDHISIEGGIHLLQYSGLNKFTSFDPVYRARIKKNDFTFVMGTLYGTVNHNLSDPIFAFENYFTNNTESGIQALWNKNRLKADLWLNWQNFIFVNDSTQEKLTAGISVKGILLKNEKWEVKLPAALILNHRGGQIDTSSANMLTAMNYSLGLLTQRNLKHNYLSSFILELQYMGFADNSPTVESIYEKGKGYMANLRLRNKGISLQGGYWYGSNFLSTQGHPIYQCYSVKGDGYHQSDRSLITSSLTFSKNLYRGVDLALIGESFYDTKSGDFDFTTGISLLLKHNFFLKSIEPVKN